MNIEAGTFAQAAVIDEPTINQLKYLMNTWTIRTGLSVVLWCKQIKQKGLACSILMLWVRRPYFIFDSLYICKLVSLLFLKPFLFYVQSGKKPQIANFKVITLSHGCGCRTCLLVQLVWIFNITNISWAITIKCSYVPSRGSITPVTANHLTRAPLRLESQLCHLRSEQNGPVTESFNYYILIEFAM